MRMMTVILVVTLFTFCKGKTVKDVEPAADDTTKFFQVGGYIESQVREINTTPYYIYKLTTVDGKKDSTPITSEQTSLLAKQFTEPDINDPSIKKNYTESVFFDQTTKTYAINYSSTNKDLVLQNIDVLLEEDGKTVKRIFLRKFFNYDDSSAMEQLSWKPNEGFEINRLVQLPSKKETASQTNVVWNAKVND